MTSHSSYLCTFIRISPFYLLFTIFQISLAVVILLALTFNWFQAISLIEIWIAFFLSLDIMIKYFSEEQRFFQSTQNKIDLLICGLVCLSMIIDITYPEEIHHKNSILSAILMIVRYLVGLYRVGSLIKTSTQLRSRDENCQINIKEENEGEEIRLN